MLFFVAMFNPVLTITLAFLTTRNSTKMWVKAEEMDLDYYLGIRTEFEFIRNELKALGMNGEIKHNFQYFWFEIMHPLIMINYKRLLVPIRFHEMRIHFLMANDLPKTFRVSQYLKRCEMNILKSLTHINIFAWLGLMAGFNLLYYILGLSHYKRDKTFAYNVFTACLIGLSLSCGMYIIMFSSFSCIESGHSPDTSSKFTCVLQFLLLSPYTRK